MWRLCLLTLLVRSRGEFCFSRTAFKSHLLIFALQFYRNTQVSRRGALPGSPHRCLHYLKRCLKLSTLPVCAYAPAPAGPTGAIDLAFCSHAFSVNALPAKRRRVFKVETVGGKNSISTICTPMNSQQLMLKMLFAFPRLLCCRMRAPRAATRSRAYVRRKRLLKVPKNDIPNIFPMLLVVMARFAWVCLIKTRELTKMLEGTLGPDTANVSSARLALCFCWICCSQNNLLKFT